MHFCTIDTIKYTKAWNFQCHSFTVALKRESLYGDDCLTHQPYHSLVSRRQQPCHSLVSSYSQRRLFHTTCQMKQKRLITLPFPLIHIISAFDIRVSFENLFLNHSHSSHIFCVSISQFIFLFHKIHTNTTQIYVECEHAHSLQKSGDKMLAAKSTLTMYVVFTTN